MMRKENQTLEKKQKAIKENQMGEDSGKMVK